MCRGTWITTFALTFSLFAAKVAALPLPPTTKQTTRWKDCKEHFAPESLPVDVRLGAPPTAPAVLNPQWSAIMRPSERIGRVISLSWLWVSYAPQPRGPLLLAGTDRGYWLLIPVENGAYDPGQPAIAFPMRGIPGPPANAAYVGMNLIVAVPSKSLLVSYDGYYCAGSSAPISFRNYSDFGGIRRMYVIDAKLHVVGEAHGAKVEAEYSPPEEDLSPIPPGAIVRSKQGKSPDSLLDFPLARGCDRLSIARTRKGAPTVAISTFCSRGFAKSEAKSEHSRSRRHRSPPAILQRRVLGIIPAPVVAADYGMPQWKAGEVFGTVPLHDRSRPGVRAWLYMVAQSARDGEITLLAFKPFRADFPRAPGGVDPPPPPPS